MEGLFRRKHNVLVMDGTDWQSLSEIIGIVGMLAYPNGNGKFTVRALDDRHKSMYVIDFKSKSEEYKAIQTMLDEYHPGLCCYDVAVG